MRQAYPGARLWAVFEPRSATSRRAVFQHEYVQALALADRVVLADVHRKDQLRGGALLTRTDYHGFTRARGRRLVLCQHGGHHRPSLP